MTSTDLAVQIDCGSDAMIGILSVPQQAVSRGVLIVVGGPQYRVGSHRQFTLLARGLAASGVPVLRFDYRGMGDSAGMPRGFDCIDDDIGAAVDTFFRAQPGLESVVLWGLCDGACAALFYARTDPRVSGVVLLNPWVRTEAGAARAQLRHYYTQRLMAPDFWGKIVSGRLDYRAALRSLGKTLRSVAAGNASEAASDDGAAERADDASRRNAPVKASRKASSLPQLMHDGFQAFDGKILLILSGRDLTAKEFLDAVSASRSWRKLLEAGRITRHDLGAADHTFSRREWRDQVQAWTAQWISSW